MLLKPHISSNAATLADFLRVQAASYYTQLAGAAPQVHLEHESLRPFSELYEFTIHGDVKSRRLFVKLPFPNRSCRSNTANRPRLFEPAAPELLASLEFTAMRHIQQSFSRLDDARFGSVHVLDLVQSPDAIVMEKAEGATLREVSGGCLGAERDVDDSTAVIQNAVFQNVGQWLRHFHQLPDLPHTRPRTTRRDHFIAMIDEFLDYFPAVRAPRWMTSVGEFLRQESESTLQHGLSLGLAHGDFAPRNVIVAANNRVTVLDTLARWRAPIYEDIALFLLSLKLGRGSKLLFTSRTKGLTTSSREFLKGYFDDASSEWPTIRLFILQAILDRGCSYLSTHSMQNPVAAVKHCCKLHVLRRVAEHFMSTDSL